MTDTARISAEGRRAAAARDWGRVRACGLEIRRLAPRDPEGPFLLGLVEKAAGRPRQAADSFQVALDLGAERYDAAIELAFQRVLLNRHREAVELLDGNRSRLSNSPRYLNLAGEGYARMGMYEEAWSLYERALELQPDVEIFQANLAACAVYLGRIDTARDLYGKLLEKHPSHQRNHYELARLTRATNDRHVEQMRAVLASSDPDPARNIFLFYALGKELEDLERWDEAFEFYRKGGDAARSAMTYDVGDDIAVIDRIVETCDAKWLSDHPATGACDVTPIFIVGLPRTGTTVTERILSSHSMVETVGETQLMQMVLRSASGIESGGEMTPQVIAAAAKAPAEELGRGYLEAVSHRLGGAGYFIDKLPENVLYLGFVAKAWPDARMVHLRREPMDACFALYKQSYFRFAYTLDDLGRYYLAYDRLSRHWRAVLGERLVEVEYERLVADQAGETKRLLDRLGLPFEEACLHFEHNVAPIATASSAQVREKLHTRSVGRWRQFETQLAPLRECLEAGGVRVGDGEGVDEK